MTDPQEIYPATPTTVGKPFEADPAPVLKVPAFDNTTNPPQEWVDQQFPDTDRGISG